MALSDDILDATIRHSVHLERYKNRIVKDILALVTDVEGRIERDLLRDRIEDMSRRDLDRLLARLRQSIRDGYEPVIATLDSALREIGEYEAGWQAGLLRDQIPVRMVIEGPSNEQIYAAAMARPFQGRLLKEWYQGLPDGQFRRIREAIRMGYVDGRTTQEIVRDVIGTRNRAGIIEQSRRGATAAVRTAVAHTAAVARNEVFRANRSILKGVEMVATLDSHTTLFCMGIDGKVFPVDEGPRPPFHVNCRTTVIPVVKSAAALGLSKISGSTRASMNGQVPMELNYNDWLKQQGTAFQDEVLGPDRARLFRGGVSVDRFTDASGHTYTLEELRTRDREAWQSVFGE